MLEYSKPTVISEIECINGSWPVAAAEAAIAISSAALAIAKAIGDDHSLNKDRVLYSIESKENIK